MKQLKLAMIAMFALLTVGNVTAQDENNPWAVGFGVNAVDVRVYREDLGINLEDYIGITDFKQNIIPSISRITVGRYLNDGFSLQLAGSINKLRVIDGNMSLKDGETDADALYWSVDAIVNYDLNNLFGETGWFDPYVGIGGGFQSIDHETTSYDGKGDGMLIGHWGFNTWLNDNLALNFNSAYKHHFTSSGYDVFQHSLGLVFQFGGKDTDGDGIYDKDDACPETPGLKQFDGCPDTDGDGIPDKDDACPNTPGLAALNGCPDTDGDGIADKDDACPKVPGLKRFRGCPDTDGDGVPDNLDKCPKVKGPKANSGCPWPDTDGDGVLDKDDKCPKVPGPASNNGCPVEKVVETVSDEDKAAIFTYAKSIFFNTNRSTFKPGVVEKLDLIVGVMNKYPQAEFIIGGHTDSRGKASYNLSLSDRRANAVKDYLISKGISSSRLSAQGYGEDYPIDTNNTRAGRANNRRVEIKIKEDIVIRN